MILGSQHRPVLLKEIINILVPEKNKIIIDATFGAGGHSLEILKRGSLVVGCDFDQEAIEQAQHKFTDYLNSHRLYLYQSNFTNLDKAIQSAFKTYPEWNNRQISAILFDFGTSTDQLLDKKRGFSFNAGNQTLDMRMDTSLTVTAKDLLLALSAKQLAKIFYIYGNEKKAKQIAQAIVVARVQNPDKVSTASGLSKIVSKFIPPGHLHPATKIFQALRIAVNNELENIKQALPVALKTLANVGKIITIAFHEGEDAIVKKTFYQWEKEGLGKRLDKKPIRPLITEIITNPRSRSAKLRAFIKGISLC